MNRPFFNLCSFVILSSHVFCSVPDVKQCGDIKELLVDSPTRRFPINAEYEDQYAGRSVSKHDTSYCNANDVGVEPDSCNGSPDNDMNRKRILELEKALNEGKSAIEAVSSMNVNDMNATSAGRDCTDVASQGFNQSGVYNITIDGRVVAVYCDLENEGGGWLIIQRSSRSGTFMNNCYDRYKNGFIDTPNSLWLGLKNLHIITRSGLYELRVELEDLQEIRVYAVYSSFSVGDASTNYTLSVTGYNGTAGDSLKHHNNHPFWLNTNQHNGGGWWKSSCIHSKSSLCFYSNLNGKYCSKVMACFQLMIWTSWQNRRYQIKEAEMKIRRK